MKQQPKSIQEMIDECCYTARGTSCKIRKPTILENVKEITCDDCKDFNFAYSAKIIQKLIEERIKDLQAEYTVTCETGKKEISAQIYILKDLHGGFETKK